MLNGLGLMTARYLKAVIECKLRLAFVTGTDSPVWR